MGYFNLPMGEEALSSASEAVYGVQFLARKIARTVSILP